MKVSPSHLTEMNFLMEVNIDSVEKAFPEFAHTASLFKKNNLKAKEQEEKRAAKEAEAAAKRKAKQIKKAKKLLEQEGLINE